MYALYAISILHTPRSPLEKTNRPALTQNWMSTLVMQPEQSHVYKISRHSIHPSFTRVLDPPTVFKLVKDQKRVFCCTKNVIIMHFYARSVGNVLTLLSKSNYFVVNHNECPSRHLQDFRQWYELFRNLLFFAVSLLSLLWYWTVYTLICKTSIIITVLYEWIVFSITFHWEI